MERVVDFIVESLLLFYPLLRAVIVTSVYEWLKYALFCMFATAVFLNPHD